ncbi:MAG TPA: squalene/phytoene synthase family protein [Solirubrobacteraceae bacterium]|jgi:phytoene synthase|nr:squalene/phytoene synthase family protein [Solirubrobacteraceae bacterium]
MRVAALEVERAYRMCESITREAAANFYYGIRLLPRPKRQAMSAVYAFARRVDDIGDDLEAGPDPADRLSRLTAERQVVAAVATGDEIDVEDPVAVALSHARGVFDLPVGALSMLIDGVELDVRGSTYETFDGLVVYCRDVAGSIGRLCLAIFAGSRHPVSAEADSLADDLGVAMQLTNILRDVREDLERRRVYLPAEDLRRWHCENLETAPPDQLAELIRFEGRRAREWFDRGLRLTEQLDARSASCVMAMTGIYREILDRIARDPLEVMHRRISLSTWEKAWVATRCLATSEAAAAIRQRAPARSRGGG